MKNSKKRNCNEIFYFSFFILLLCQKKKRIEEETMIRNEGVMWNIAEGVEMKEKKEEDRGIAHEKRVLV